MGDGGLSAADIKAQMQAAGKPDPGLQYLREVHLTSEEEAELSAKARGDIPGETIKCTTHVGCVSNLTNRVRCSS